jgi:hypothetical protein
MNTSSIPNNNKAKFYTIKQLEVDVVMAKDGFVCFHDTAIKNK